MLIVSGLKVVRMYSIDVLRAADIFDLLGGRQGPLGRLGTEGSQNRALGVGKQVVIVIRVVPMVGCDIFGSCFFDEFIFAPGHKAVHEVGVTL